MTVAALPAGPRLPGLMQSLGLLTRPVPFLQRCRRRYGDVFTVRAAPLGTLVYLAEPDLVRQVFAGAPETFHTGDARAMLSPILGHHSLLLLDEDEHLRERKLMLPPFHGEALARHRELIDEIARADLDTWPVGEPFAVMPHTQAITLEVILRVVIGTRDPERLDRLRSTLRQLLGLDLTLLFAVMTLGREPRWLPAWRRFERLRAETHALLQEEIEQRRADAGGDDVLSMLVRTTDETGDRLTDGELRDELVTLLLAGHETTASSLAWALERLVRHPAALARLREGDDGYLDAVVKETLRVRPVVNEVTRDLTEPVELGGHRLPAGTRIMMSIALLQRETDYHDDPAAFRPERFLNGGSPSPYTFIPFGGGRRRCLGASFALLEMAVVLRAIVERYDVEAADARPERARNRGITYAPSRGGEILVRPR